MFSSIITSLVRSFMFFSSSKTLVPVAIYYFYISKLSAYDYFYRRFMVFPMCLITWLG